MNSHKHSRDCMTLKGCKFGISHQNSEEEADKKYDAYYRTPTGVFAGFKKGRVGSNVKEAVG